MNRVLFAIERRRAQLAAGIKPDGSPLTGDTAKVERSLRNSFAEHAHYQDLQARAFVTGKLTQEEAQTIYHALGATPSPDGWAQGTDLAAKIIITQIMAELMGMEEA